MKFSSFEHGKEINENFAPYMIKTISLWSPCIEGFEIFFYMQSLHAAYSTLVFLLTQTADIFSFFSIKPAEFTLISFRWLYLYTPWLAQLVSLIYFSLQQIKFIPLKNNISTIFLCDTLNSLTAIAKYLCWFFSMPSSILFWSTECWWLEMPSMELKKVDGPEESVSSNNEMT